MHFEILAQTGFYEELNVIEQRKTWLGFPRLTPSRNSGKKIQADEKTWKIFNLDFCILSQNHEKNVNFL